MMNDECSWWKMIGQVLHLVINRAIVGVGEVPLGGRAAEAHLIYSNHSYIMKPFPFCWKFLLNLFVWSVKFFHFFENFCSFFFECLLALGNKLTCALFKLWRILAPESQSSPALDKVVLIGEIMGIQANHIEWVTKIITFSRRSVGAPPWITKNHHCLVTKVMKSEHSSCISQEKMSTFSNNDMRKQY